MLCNHHLNIHKIKFNLSNILMIREEQQDNKQVHSSISNNLQSQVQSNMYNPKYIKQKLVKININNMNNKDNNNTNNNNMQATNNNK